MAQSLRISSLILLSFMWANGIKGQELSKRALRIGAVYQLHSTHIGYDGIWSYRIPSISLQYQEKLSNDKIVQAQYVFVDNYFSPINTDQFVGFRRLYHECQVSIGKRRQLFSFEKHFVRITAGLFFRLGSDRFSENGVLNASAPTIDQFIFDVGPLVSLHEEWFIHPNISLGFQASFLYSLITHADNPRLPIYISSDNTQLAVFVGRHF
ncbi:MAG: hypothetical protein AAFY71_13045 [Bacteroidota bacterium]